MIMPNEVPKQSGLIVRSRLLERLEPEHYRRIRLLHAPAGFGKTEVAKRHRNNKAMTTERALLGISHNACQRGSHRAGIYRMSGEVPDEARKKIKAVLGSVLADAIAVVEYCKRKTINSKDVQFAIANQKNRTANPRIYS